MVGRWRILFGDVHEILRAVRKPLFFCLIASCSSSLWAPAFAGETAMDPAYELTVSSWTTDNGLPGNAVSALAPARDGYLWVGSPNGLARFDGFRFVRFHMRDGLTSLEIRQL